MLLMMYTGKEYVLLIVHVSICKYKHSDKQVAMVFLCLSSVVCYMKLQLLMINTVKHHRVPLKCKSLTSLSSKLYIGMDMNNKKQQH